MLPGVSLRFPTSIALLLGLAPACDPPSPGETAAPLEAPEHTLVVVVMDGVRLEESLGEEASTATGEQPAAMMPELWDQLVPIGHRSTYAWNASATTTVPAHATMLIGRRQPLGNFAMGNGPGMYRPTLPVLHEWLEVAGGIEPERSLVVANSVLLEGLNASLWAWPDGEEPSEATFLFAQRDDGGGTESDRATLRRLRNQLDKGPVALALVNLHQVDREGHKGEPQDYPQAVRDLDEPITELWRWIETDPRYAGRTWMLVLADHGRNSTGNADPTWRHHGCQCNGCRRVPLLLLGPGVRAAAESDSPALLTDVAPTLAALLGIPHPWADGLVRDDWLDSPTLVPSREGLADLAVGGSHRAELYYTDDPAHRKELLLDGMEVSNPEAIEVEAPVLTASDDRAWLCWRELVLTPEEEETQWQARCLATEDGGLSWADIGGPTEPVGPWWRPALVPTDSGVVAAYAYNPSGLSSDNASAGQGAFGVQGAAWDEEGWSLTTSVGDIPFPTDLSAVMLTDGQLLVALAGSTDVRTARYTRAIWSGRADLSRAWPRWAEMSAMQLTEIEPDGGDEWRLEHPALHVDASGEPWLAAVAYGADGVQAVVATGLEDQAWAQQATVDLPGSPLPHLAPIWIDDRPAWAILDGTSGLVSVCAALPGEQADCAQTSSERLLRLVAGDDELLAVVDGDVGQWKILQLEHGELRDGR